MGKNKRIFRCNLGRSVGKISFSSNLCQGLAPHAKLARIPGASGGCPRHTHITEEGAGRRQGPSTEKCHELRLTLGMINYY